MPSLRNLQLLVFEAGDGCNLACQHDKCPAHTGDRWGADPAAYLTDEQIIDAAVTCITDYQFSGLVCWHYYNEPMLYIDRILRLSQAIRERAPEARFGLWTNGTICPTPEQAEMFYRVWVTRYAESKAAQEIEKVCSKTIVSAPIFDDRITAHGAPTCCWRPYIELVFDARGYAHLCCQAYHADQNIGSLHNEPIGDIVARYIALRDGLKQGVDGAPPYCVTCGIPIDWLYSAHPRLAVVSLVKNEADILPGWYQHYRPLADLIVVTDNGSTDGTREMLAKMQEQDPDLIVIDQESDRYLQAEWTNHMIDIARDRGCGWAVPADADEIFWFANGRIGLDDMLFANRQSDAIRLHAYNYHVTREDDLSVACPLERMQHRDLQPHSGWSKVIVKTDPHVRVVLGNHNALVHGRKLAINPVSADKVHIKHYPERSWEHYRRKVIQGGEMMMRRIKDGTHQHGTAYQWVDPYKVYAQCGGLPELWRLWDSSLQPASNLQRDPLYASSEDTHSGAAAHSNACQAHERNKLLARVQEARALRSGPTHAEGSVAVHVVATAYKIPVDRVESWIGWHDADAWPATLVVDQDTAAALSGRLPAWCDVLIYDRPMDRFSLARTSNAGIRRAIDRGFAGCIVKTDIDVLFLPDFARACTRIDNRRVLVPHYRMGDRPGDVKATVWAATCGTIAALASTWCAVCGYDERQDGYGVEDGDCLDRCRRAGYHIDRMQHVLHVAHELGAPQKYRQRSDQWNRDTINPVNHAHNQSVRSELWRSADWGLAVSNETP